MQISAYTYTNRGGRDHNEDSVRASAAQGVFVLADGLGGHGSGEVFLGFSTTNRVPHESARAVLPCTVLHEGRIDAVFRAMGEATEEAVLRAMLCADTVTGFDGSTKYTIRNFISQIY